VWVAVTNDVNGVGAYPGAGRKISMDGATVLESIGNMDRPFDVAVDSGGNVWFTSLSGGKVYLVQGTSPFQKFYGGGSIKMPWGLVIDGDDKVYVADFGGEGVTVLCGTKPEKCPPGYKTGDSISPSGQAYGHGSGALMRLTAVAMDQSGNVWADNWKTVPVTLPNPGGDGLVQFVGLAA